jgi:hypothetical protein
MLVRAMLSDGCAYKISELCEHVRRNVKIHLLARWMEFNRLYALNKLALKRKALTGMWIIGTPRECRSLGYRINSAVSRLVRKKLFGMNYEGSLIKHADGKISLKVRVLKRKKKRMTA